MTKTRTERVREFHQRHSFDEDLSLLCTIDKSSDESRGSIELETAARVVDAMAQQWRDGKCKGEECVYDTRLLRAHLILEEAAEVLMALSERNEVDLLDGLADLAYVTDGTAVAYNLPLEEAVVEVHLSNMTKAVSTGTDKDVRCNKKGDAYVPPNLHDVLKRSRKNDNNEVRS